MKKRGYLLGIMILLMTGCTADYTIEVKDGVIKEALYVGEKNLTKALEKDDMNMSFQDYAIRYGREEDYYTSYYNMYKDEGATCEETKENDCRFYNKELINTEQEIGFKLFSDFSYEKYGDATIPNDMMPGFSATFDGRYLNLMGGSNWNFLKGYQNLEKLSITIKTNYHVTATNAKYEGNGVYKFEVTKLNNQDLPPLYITFDTTSTKRLQKENSKLVATIILGTITIAMVIIGTRLYIKHKNNDQI